MSHERGCGRRGSEAQSRETEAGVVAGDVEHVFDGDGETVERADGLAGAREVGVEDGGAGEGGFEEELC